MTFGLFLVAIFLYIFSSLLILSIMSIFIKKPEGYVNMYRLPQREEHENYKRYINNEYKDSLRNYRRSR